jgi:peptidoglycan/xylan/chitin deacetylase (PgdA/CDA1 family)
VRRRLAVALLTGLAAIGAFVAYQPLWVFDVLAIVYPRVLWRVETTAPLVALTFDDGPAPKHTPNVLAILARHGARGTFFLIGDHASRHPGLVTAIRGGGHEVANHYTTRGSALRDSDDDFAAKLRRTEAILDLTAPKLFRPPGGLARPSQLRIAAAAGYTTVLGSAYPYDGQRPPARYIRWLVTKNLAPGVIVILHDGIRDPSRSIAALEDILRAGHRKGLRFVTVGELLKAVGQ